MLFRVLLIFVASLLATSIVIADRPNVLLILADDVGREVLGSYGGESYQTPHLDALAEGGMRFEHCYSMPVCHPSRVCLLTGQYPARLGNPRWGSFPKQQEAHTVASLLKKSGYKTAVAGKWQLSLMKNDLMQPGRMGFDEWSLFGWHEGPRYHDPMIYENGKLRNDTAGKYGPDLYVQFLIDFIEQNKQAPFFAFYSMALCHDVTDDIGQPVPYGPDGHWLTYEEMANDMDRQVGKLVSALDRLGLREQTLILFTTDNGTAGASYLQYEDGKFVRPKVFSKFDGRMVPGGKGRLNDWGTRVPLIANWPEQIEKQQVVDDLVDFSDFLPTLVEITESGVLADHKAVDGVSFASRLRGTGQSVRKWAYSEHRGKRFVRIRTHKLYGTGELFDLRSDPEERSAVSNSKDKESAETRAMLKSVLESLPEPK